MINYTDFKNALESVNRPSLWNILSIYGVPEKYINIFKSLCADSSCCIKTEIGVRFFHNSIRCATRLYSINILFFILLDFVMQ